MLMQLIPSQSALNVSAGAVAVSAAQTATTTGAIHVGPWAYTAIAVILGLIGVVLARLVTIGDENKRLGTKQPFLETLPLTAVGVLIVGPFIWHFSVAIPWASMIGLGVGYSVKLVLKVFGGGAVDAARVFARSAARALDDGEPVSTKTSALSPPGPTVVIGPTDMPQDQQDLLGQLQDVPPTPQPGEKE